jgi:multiple sugar transport system ATP-binding protein
MTVADNIGFPLILDRLHRDDIDRRVREIARLLRIDDVLQRRPAQLCGGQQQRIAMGGALVRRPRLLLLDEPMSNLDAKLRLTTGFVIGGLQRSLDLTTLMVTHDQHEAMAMGDRLVVMRDGVIVQHGRPIDVHDAPANIFVAQFIGSPPMNIVEATIIDADGVIALRVGSHTVPVDPLGFEPMTAMPRLVGRTVGLGFRPDALRRDADGSLDLDVLSTTLIAREQFVHLEIDARRVTDGIDGATVADPRTSTIVMSAPADSEFSLWEPCRVDLDTTRIHLFDLVTGDRIG